MIRARPAVERILRKSPHWLLAMAVLTSLQACGGSLGPATLGVPMPSLPQMPALPEFPALQADQVSVSGTTVDVYSAVARGALVCWMGANGPLKTTHIFHAEALPPSSGTGGAEIAIHQRDPSQPSPRGVRALRITFADTGGETTKVTFENLKLPQDLGDAMLKDTLAWARLGESCQAQVVRPPAPPPPVVQAKPKKPKKRA
jgi:hypothetical protein